MGICLFLSTQGQSSVHGLCINKCRSQKFPAFKIFHVINTVELNDKKPLVLRKISSSGGMIKSRAFAWKSCQNSSSSVGMTKSRAFAGLHGNLFKTYLSGDAERIF